MKIVIAALLGLAAPAWAQTARPLAAGAENQALGPELEPVLPAPMPCDVVFYMRELRLPELPASLVSP